jgi:hypothetical protein
VELGDLVSRQAITVVVKVDFPAGQSHDELSARVRLISGTGRETVDEKSLRWRFASHQENDAQPRDAIVDREVAELYAARARGEAGEANREGDFRRARRVLERTAERVREYAGNDEDLRRVWQQLLEEVPRYAEQVMSPMVMKSAFFRAESRLKDRSEAGSARRVEE